MSEHLRKTMSGRIIEDTALTRYLLQRLGTPWKTPNELANRPHQQVPQTHWRNSHSPDVSRPDRGFLFRKGQIRK